MSPFLLLFFNEEEEGEEAAEAVVVRVLGAAELLRLVVHYAPVSCSLSESTEPTAHLLSKRFVRLTV